MTSPDFPPLGDNPLGIRSQGASDADGPPAPSKDGSETVRRRNTGVRGIVASLKYGIAMPWRWDAERDFMHLLEVDPDVLSYQRHQQPVALIIGHLHENHGTGLEARCLLLTGLRGAGKSTVLKRYALRHPDTAEELRDRRPILQLDVPAEATLRSLASTMLATLGDLVRSRGNQVEMTVRVQGLLRKLGVELVILDEIHHLIHSSTHKIAYDAAEWIKGMLNANICPFVLAGQPYADRIVRSNPQLWRRCEGEVYLPSYHWKDEGQQTEFRVVLNTMEHALELPGASRLGSYDTSLRIHHFSRGLLGNAGHLVETAYDLALRRELPCLSHELLAEATDWLRVRKERRLVNPFRVPSIRPVRPAERDEALVPHLRDEVARRSRKPRGGNDAA